MSNDSHYEPQYIPDTVPVSSAMLDENGQPREHMESCGDYASIPTLSDLKDFQRHKVLSGHYLRIAPDVYDWLTAQGPDWEEKADAILRREMLLARGL